MWWLILWSLVYAHPFEAQFVGHKTQIQVHPNELILHTSVEVPIKLIESYFQSSGEQSKRDWLQGWMDQLTEDISKHWLIDVNQQMESWQSSKCKEPELREDSTFLVFTCTLSIPLQLVRTELVLVDQILIEEPSVYWKQISIAQSIDVLSTDQIEWKNKERTRYATHLERWEMEESQREIRLIFDSNWINQLDGWWRQNIWMESSNRSLQQSVLNVDWWRHWTLGQVHWVLACAVCTLTLFTTTYFRRKYHWVGVLGLALFGISLLPVIPWRWKVAAMVLIFCTSLFSRFRLPLWVLIFGLLVPSAWVFAAMMIPVILGQILTDKRAV